MQTMVFERTETREFRELLEKYRSKTDVNVPANSLVMDADGRIASKEYVAIDREPVMFDAQPTEWAYRQIAEYLGIHWHYMQKMMGRLPVPNGRANPTPAFDLMAQNVNYWFSRSRDNRLVRVFQGELIGFLSDQYQAIDNFDAVASAWSAATEALNGNESTLELNRPYLSETRMNATILTTEFIELEPGNSEEQYRMGINLVNSEVGNGAFNIRPLLLRTSCMNSNIFKGAGDEFTFKRVHRGRTLPIGVVWSNDTQKLQSATLRAEIVDVTRAAFDRKVAQDRIDHMKRLKDESFKPTKARIEASKNILGLGDKESNGIWDRIEANNRYEFLQAVTSYAQTYYTKGGNAERGTELEELGGELAMNRSIWDAIEKQTEKEEGK